MGVLLINTLGCVVVYSVFKGIHHQQIEQYLTKNSVKKVFESLHLTREAFNGLVWRRPDKEFERDNNLYDVVSVHYNGDSVLIVCYEDHHEKKMERQFAKKLDSKNADKSTPSSRLAAMLGQLFISQPATEFFYTESACHTRDGKEYFNYCIRLSTPHITIFSPPPNSFLIG